MGNLYEAWSRGRERGAERAKQSQLAELMGPAMQGDSGAQSKLFGVDPQAGLQVQTFSGTQKKQAQDQFGKLSTVLARTKDPQFYPGWRQAGIAAGALPATTPEQPANDPVELERVFAGAQQIAQAYGGGEDYTLSPGAKRFDASNREVAAVPFAPAKPEYQLYDGADGPAWLPKPTGAPQPNQMGGGAGVLFDGAYQDVLKREGGFVANDAGAGPTNFGINSRANPDLNVASLTPESARGIYKERYWDAIGADRLPPQIREAAFDTAVNMGPEKAKQLVQESGGDPQKFAVLRQQHYDRLAQQNPGKYGQYAEGWRNRNMQTAGLNAIPVAGVRPKPKAADAPSALQERIELAKRMGASEAELRQMVIGKEGAAAGARPMPVAALKIIKEETDAANTATAINTSLDKHLGRIKSGKLDFGPIANQIYAGRNASGMSTEESRNFAEFKSDLEKLRNDSLRLNNGVQTDGDAQRAWNELVANINDTDYVKQRLQTIKGLNERARNLRQLNAEMIKENYGRGESSEQAAPAQSAPKRLKYNPATGRLE